MPNMTSAPERTKAALAARVCELGLELAVRAELQRIGLPAAISGRHRTEHTDAFGGGFVLLIGNEDLSEPHIAGLKRLRVMPETLEVTRMAYTL